MAETSRRVKRRTWVTWVRKVGRVATYALLLVGAILAAASLWVRRTFGMISVDQMLTNLPAGGGDGATGAETGYISGFVWEVLVIPALIVALVPVIAAVVQRRMRSSSRSFIALRRDPAAARRRAVLAGRVSSWGAGLASVAVLALGAALFAQTIGLVQHVRSLTTDLTLSSYYVAPAATAQEHPKNLVLIYLESMEEAFGDERFVEKNALAPIQRATGDWSQIENLRQYDGGGWTMAGIVGTQCGIPLRGIQTARENELDRIGEDSDTYLPGATCLGDVLADAGYENVFLGGADAAFAAKGTFLTTHGFDEVLDLDHWLEEGEEERSDWGISDRALMDHARDEVDRLHASGRPFNLTMLTLDTHDPEHAFEYCPITTDVGMTSIMRCSMEQVAGFVDHLEQRGYLDDTVVVVMGDHERFISDQSSYQELKQLEDRPIFNRIWSPDGAEFAREDIDQLSMFATMLDLLGFEVQDHRAGVGVSALATEVRADSILALSPDEYREVVESRSSDLYTTMWGLGEGETVEADYFDPKHPDRVSGAADDSDGARWWEPRGPRDRLPAPPALHAG
ncbi:sulfatase-like hydrolase/transferase [Leucobacter ruminantium]|uniref:Sulfatase-like hydrolase/transferase n=1 Tax=Leucobacter ruminantium TaxID=1289170 RepID=A0A939LYP9_9MICO|nr:sulfatase-like hydrolase/transferase [Leucobacter ruminantium]MBO1805563.1 sulfatase-like hydrolase/transferase [Leucobacter ruminantium]